jgi:hypothetical protein
MIIYLKGLTQRRHNKKKKRVSFVLVELEMSRLRGLEIESTSTVLQTRAEQ